MYIVLLRKKFENHLQEMQAAKVLLTNKIMFQRIEDCKKGEKEVSYGITTSSSIEPNFFHSELTQ